MAAAKPDPAALSGFFSAKNPPPTLLLVFICAKPTHLCWGGATALTHTACRYDRKLQGHTNHVPLEHPGAVHISLCGQRSHCGREGIDGLGAGGAHQGDGERRPRDRTADGRPCEPPYHYFWSPFLLRRCLASDTEVVKVAVLPLEEGEEGFFSMCQSLRHE